MDASDADAPVATPYIGSKMESPAPPSLQRQPSPPPPQSSLNSPPATSSIPPDSSSTAGTDPTKLSTTERIKLSVSALITRRDSSTPAADHFTVLPGDAPHSRAESFAVQQNNPDQHSKLDQQGHAIRHGLSSDSEKQWGMEGLLRSKAGTAGGAAADAKRKLSAHLGLSAKRGEEGGEQQQQSCEYVAMNTPCESPVASGGAVDQEVSPPTLAAACKQPNCSATSNSHWLACTRRVVWVCLSCNLVVYSSTPAVAARTRNAGPGWSSYLGQGVFYTKFTTHGSRISFFRANLKFKFQPDFPYDSYESARCHVVFCCTWYVRIIQQ